MIKSYFKKQILFLTLLFVPLITVAAVPSWQIVPDKSSLTFTGVQNDAPVSGKFKKFTGDIKFDPAQLNASSVKIVVDTNSVFTSYSDLVDALKTADWFNVKLFPQ